MRNTTTLVLAAAALAACSSDKPAESPATASPTPSAPAAASGPLTPDPGGKVIAVEMVSDGNGNFFKPAEVHARKGDVIRYTLKVGVHNVHFLADSNAGKSGFPSAASDMLQLPGQTHDVMIRAPGSYYFQCDPHAALGMKGHVIVE